MRAVNLIPAELRRGGSAPGRTGIAPYAVLGVLALLVVMASAYTLTTRSLGSKKAEVASIEQQAAAAEARTTSNKSYTEFSQLSVQRTQTVTSLAASRFDWAHALAEVARVLPHNAWLASIRATVTPGVAVDGAADPLRQTLQLPAIELSGCTTSQANVAQVVADLRRADGVKRVSLSSAKKTDATGTTAAPVDPSSADTGDCTQGNADRPKFSMTLFYDGPTVPSASATGTAGATTTGTAAAPTTGSTGTTTTGSTGTTTTGSAGTTTTGSTGTTTTGAASAAATTTGG
jgi:Tfp pilus assembly protein PilN